MLATVTPQAVLILIALTVGGVGALFVAGRLMRRPKDDPGTPQAVRIAIALPLLLGGAALLVVAFALGTCVFGSGGI